MPAYVLVVLYGALALFFPDRWIYLLGLSLALLLYLGTRRLGRLVGTRLQISDETIFFPFGLGIFLLLTYAAAVISTNFVLYFWILAGILAIFELKILFRKILVRLLWALPFVFLGFWSSYTPSIFFDTLVYHLGLPMQDLLAGKMRTVPHNVFSAFPPFEFVLNLLFVKLNALSGIKVFSILLLFHIAYVLVDLTAFLIKNESNRDLKSEFIVLPLFILPSVWIQIHLVTADLLVAMFLVSAICNMIKNRFTIAHNQLIAIAILAAWAGWTKPTALPYIFLIPTLWIPLKVVQVNLKKLILFFAIIFLFISPILVRNYVVTGDPLYPALSKALDNPNWSLNQQLAWAVDTSRQLNRILTVPVAPFEIIFTPHKYGSAAEIGVFYLLSLIVYLVFWKKHPLGNRLLIFLVLCYIAWCFLFRDFRQLFPVFLLIHVPCALALNNLFSYKKWVPALVLSISAIFSIHLLLPIFKDHIKLIHFDQTQEKYLKENLDYYPLVEWSESIQKNGKMLMLGESRVAYLKIPVVAVTAFDKHPFFMWLSQAPSPDVLYKQFQNSNIEFMMVNWQEYARIAEKCGLLPIDFVPAGFRDVFKKGKARTGVPLAHLTKREMEVLSEFSKSCLTPKWRMGDQYLVWEVRCNR